MTSIISATRQLFQLRVNYLNYTLLSGTSFSAGIVSLYGLTLDKSGIFANLSGVIPYLLGIIADQSGILLDAHRTHRRDNSARAIPSIGATPRSDRRWHAPCGRTKRLSRNCDIALRRCPARRPRHASFGNIGRTRRARAIARPARRFSARLRADLARAIDRASRQ
jgi:hypothetical protein